MPWIDELITTNHDKVPSIERIFELYIKPYAELEVNISGKLQTKLVTSFMESPSALKLVSDVELSSIALTERTSVSITEDTDPLSLSEGRLTETYSQDMKRGTTFKLDNVQPATELVIIPLKSDTGSTMLPKTNTQSSETYTGSPSKKKSRTLKELTVEKRLAELYPVWKELVMLLHNDTFVRYREFLAKEEKGLMVVL